MVMRATPMEKNPTVPHGSPEADPRGNKRTEIGAFPADWDVCDLSDIVAINPETLPTSTDSEFEFNYISIEQVDVGRLVVYSEECFGSALSRARRILRP